jgi:hypothetical protein
MRITVELAFLWHGHLACEWESKHGQDARATVGDGNYAAMR